MAPASRHSTSATRRPSDHVLGVILRAYPAPFRARYASEILMTLRDQRRALGSVRRSASAAFWARASIDLLRSAATERIADARDRTAATPRRVARGCLGVLLVAYAIGNVVYDIAEPTLRMGWLAILVTALSGLTGLGILWQGRPAT